MEDIKLEKIKNLQFTSEEEKLIDQKKSYKNFKNKYKLYAYLVTVKRFFSNKLQYQFNQYKQQNRQGIDKLDKYLNFSYAELYYTLGLFGIIRSKKISLYNVFLYTTMFIIYNEYSRQQIIKKQFPEDYSNYIMAKQNINQFMQEQYKDQNVFALQFRKYFNLDKKQNIQSLLLNEEKTFEDWFVWERYNLCEQLFKIVHFI